MSNPEELLDQLSFESIGKLGDFLESSPDGMQLLGALLSLPDKDFEIIRPLFQESMIESFQEPQILMQLTQALAQSGISTNDIINNIDDIINKFMEDEEAAALLSDEKRDFIKTIMIAMSNAISSCTINPAHIVEIPVEVCRDNAKIPTYATDGSAALDIYSPEEYIINPGETIVIPIGIKVNIPHGYALLIQPRSGLSRKSKLRVANTPGLIDEDYHEEIGVIIENISPFIDDVDQYLPSDHFELVKKYGAAFTIGKGERFAQMRLVEVPRVKWKEVTSLGTFENDHGAGFGSTGEK